jgi:SAM-dependent methyltransferase
MPRPSTEAARVGLLVSLYERWRASAPGDDYLASHAFPTVVRARGDVFAWYEPHLPRSGRILDWGCRHAPDSCLIRERLGDAVELHACDLCEPDVYRPFHGFARLHYRKLDHFCRLPYPDDAFDAAIGSGTLEHVAMDYESLKELHRVLTPGGKLVLTYLPNRLSVAEWWRRVVRRKDFHRRLYGPGEIARLLSRAGFYPLTVRHQSWADALPPRGRAQRLLRLASWALPLRLISSTLCAVAVKRLDM